MLPHVAWNAMNAGMKQRGLWQRGLYRTILRTLHGSGAMRCRVHCACAAADPPHYTPVCHRRDTPVAAKSARMPEGEHSQHPEERMCLACGAERMQYACVPCGCPALCITCARKMATGGRCKACKQMFTELKRLHAHHEERG